jgi:hypothetical protein
MKPQRLLPPLIVVAVICGVWFFVAALPGVIAGSKPWWLAGLGVVSLLYGLVVITLFVSTRQVDRRAKSEMVTYGIAAVCCGVGVLSWLAETTVLMRIIGVGFIVSLLISLFLSLRGPQRNP